MQRLPLAKILLVLLALCAAIPAIKQLREPDVWWMLATGEHILKNISVPKVDIFSFTHAGVEWVNVKWGFEVILALFARMGGAEFTLLLQAIANLLLLWTFLRWWRKEREGKETDPAAFGLAFMFLISVMEFRMNGRPEMVSHLFTAVYVVAILRTQKSQAIPFWLIPLQVLWANLHEAYGTGQVIITIALAAGWLQQIWLQGKISGTTFLKKWGLLWLGVMAAPALHPRGLRMIWHPYEIFRQVGANKFTTELVGFSDPAYWQKEAWMLMILAVFVTGVLIFQFRNAEGRNFQLRLRAFISRIGLVYPALIAAFFYLALTAYRNIPFFAVVAFPLLLSGLSHLLQYAAHKWKALSQIRLLGMVCALLVLFYISFASNIYYTRLDDGRDRFGLKINESMHPIGAAKFLAENPVAGPVYSDFLVANYLLWKVPGYKTYIDLRDLDIFTEAFFNRFASQSVFADSLFAELKKYDCQRAVLLRSAFDGLHRNLSQNPEWNIAYADAVAVVWEKGAQTEIMGFEPIADALPGGAAQAVTMVFNPFYRPYKWPVETEKLAVNYFYNLGMLDETLAGAKKLQSLDAAGGRAWEGRVYLNKSTRDTGALQGQYLDSAIKSINEAAALNPRHEMVFTTLAEYYLITNNLDEAQSQLLALVEIFPENIWAWSQLADIQISKALADPPNQTAFIRNQARYLQKAVDIDPSNLNLAFYLGIAYGQTGNCKGCVKYLSKNIDAVMVPENDRALARQLLKSCSQ